MIVWIIVAVVIAALAVFAFRPRNSGGPAEEARRHPQTRGTADLYDGHPPL